MKIAVVTDSTAYLTPQQIRENDIYIVPIPVILDGEVYDEGIDITTEEFYAKLRQSTSFPSTSQPSIGKLMELYGSLAAKGYDTVISIHLASTISGLTKTISAVAKEMHDINVICFDSRITVMLMGNLCIQAARMAKANKSATEIIAELEALRQTIDEYFIVDDLQNLVRGGRLSNASAFIGTVLKIKPILTFDDTDQIVAFDKVRSSKRALKRVEDLFAQKTQNIDYPLRLIIIHANDSKAAEAWKEELAQKYPDYPIDISYFGPVIGTHLGEKALALGWIRDIDK